MWRLSPSKLDSYLAFKYDKYGTSLEDYLQQIRGVFEPTEAMKRGTAIHKVLEDPMTKDIFDLLPEELEQIKEIGSMIPKGIVNEMFVGYTMEDIRYNMFVDRIVGRQVHDFKTGHRYSGVEAYDGSMQWRLYLLGTGCTEFIYHVITYGETFPATFTYHNPFSFYPYKGMEREVLQVSRDFIEFCIHHHVEGFITEKPRGES